MLQKMMISIIETLIQTFAWAICQTQKLSNHLGETKIAKGLQRIVQSNGAKKTSNFAIMTTRQFTLSATIATSTVLFVGGMTCLLLIAVGRPGMITNTSFALVLVVIGLFFSVAVSEVPRKEYSRIHNRHWTTAAASTVPMLIVYPFSLAWVLAATVTILVTNAVFLSLESNASNRFEMEFTKGSPWRKVDMMRRRRDIVIDKVSEKINDLFLWITNHKRIFCLAIAIASAIVNYWVFFSDSAITTATLVVQYTTLIVIVTVVVSYLWEFAEKLSPWAGEVYSAAQKEHCETNDC